MPVQHIYLVGFMGAGKSTVGREIALKLARPFFDLDSEIEKAETLSVREIFERGMVAIVVDGDEFLGLITRIDLLNWLRRQDSDRKSRKNVK